MTSYVRRMTSSKSPPKNGPEFEAMMVEIDSKLASEGIEIPARPLLAVREVSMRYDIAMPLAGLTAGMAPHIKRNAELSEAMKRWYDDTYGDRLKEDPCPGRTAFLLENDVYVLRIPRLFGSVRFVISREFISDPGISRAPVTCNIVQLIEHITPAKAARLSNEALDATWHAFDRALPALYILEATDHELMHIARGDVAVAVGNLMDKGERYGESKWASLQAAEKVMKAALSMHGEQFKHIHHLQTLAGHLTRIGINIDAGACIDAIQCQPSIRYGDESCTREEAVRAHQASLDVVNKLMNAGAKFQSGIGGWQRE